MCKWSIPLAQGVPHSQFGLLYLNRVKENGQLELHHHEEAHRLIQLAINMTPPPSYHTTVSLVFSKPEVCKYSPALLYYIQPLLYSMTPWESTTEEKVFLGGLTVSSI